MNKSDLISMVADDANLSKTDAAAAVEATFKTIQSALKKKDDVKIIGFGSFLVTHRKASKRMNPATKKQMMVPAMNVPKFKAGKALKEAVNG